jgi:hypothetical protein
LMRHVDKKCLNVKSTASYKDFEFCLRRRDKLLLFVKVALGRCFKPCFSCRDCRKTKRRASKLAGIYEEGIKKVKTSLNVASLIRTNRTLKILLENLILSDDIVHRIDHHDQNLIDCKDYKVNKILDLFRKGLQSTIVNLFVAKLNAAREEPKNNAGGLLAAFGRSAIAGAKPGLPLLALKKE